MIVTIQMTTDDYDVSNIVKCINSMKLHKKKNKVVPAMPEVTKGIDLELRDPIPIPDQVVTAVPEVADAQVIAMPPPTVIDMASIPMPEVEDAQVIAMPAPPPVPPVDVVPAPVAVVPPPPVAVVPPGAGPRIPWDKRIHSKNKSLLKDGEYRQKKNISPELIAQVEAELLGGIPTPLEAAACTTVTQLIEVINASGLTLVQANQKLLAAGFPNFDGLMLPDNVAHIPEAAAVIKS
jgi:hypothetical protein